MEMTLTVDGNPQFEIEMKLFFESINLKYSYDFRNYKPASLKRTLVQAIKQMGCLTLSGLQEKVLHDLGSFYDLIQILTVPVSEMFRDPGYFLALREKVVPILKTYPSIKVWVAGCSTGEEAYSLAIVLYEEDLLNRTTFYGTDINPRSLEKAKKGRLRLQALGGFGENYTRSGGRRSPSDYYTAALDSVSFHDFLKEKITFADHSLATDTVFTEAHLISCRNVLIYFDRELQERALGLFYDSLLRKCFLGLGSKESLHFSMKAKHFDRFAKKERIFRKK